MNQLLWYLLAGTRGGEMRCRMLLALKDKPQNAHRLAKLLQVDYTTVQHHAKILLDNRIITVQGKYGAVFFIAEDILKEWKDFAEIWERIRKK